MRQILPALLVALGSLAVHAGARTPWDLPPGVPPPFVPDPATLTPARVALGRQLFYETRLSVNGTQSCGTCHRREFAFTDTRPRAVGATGQVHPRASMSLVNVAYRDALTWADPELTSLEQQALVPMFGEHPIELGLKGREAEVYRSLGEDAMYVRLFAEAFPGAAAPITTEHIASALASFERTIVSFRSPYDRYRFNGDASALSPAARRGETLFFSRAKAGCSQCHGGLNLDGGSRTAASDTAASDTTPRDTAVRDTAVSDTARPVFHNTGLFTKYMPPNVGLQERTGKPEDEGLFRVPTLRNIARTAPYMHDGSIATLAEVLDHYAAGGRAPHPNRSPLLRPLTLTAADRLDLVAFLDSLTDVDALVDTRWGDPWQTRYE